MLWKCVFVVAWWFCVEKNEHMFTWLIVTHGGSHNFPLFGSRSYDHFKVYLLGTSIEICKQIYVIYSWLSELRLLVIHPTCNLSFYLIKIQITMMGIKRKNLLAYGSLSKQLLPTVTVILSKSLSSTSHQEEAPKNT